MPVENVAWIKTRIAEPFPVFYSHTNQKCRRANDPRTEGPFYAAGAEFFSLHSELAEAAAHKAADHLRADGYTVAVEVIDKPTWISSRRRAKAGA